MKAFSLFVSLAVFVSAATFAHAESDKPKQGPPVMTEQQIKDYVDAAVKAEVKAQLSAAFPALASRAAATAKAPVGYTIQSCPAGATCPAGCIDNGDGTCSCPAGTSCGMGVGYVVPNPPGVMMSGYTNGTYQTSQGVYYSSYADDGSGNDASGGVRKRKRFHLFGRPKFRP